MRLRNGILFILSLVVISSLTWVIEASEPSKTTFGDPKAIKGGLLTLHSPVFPKSFNYFVNNAAEVAGVFNLVYDSLMEINPITLEFQPLIAESWKISDDKKVFTIKIDPRAKWADGKPITTEDIKFTYDVIMDPNNLTSVQRLFIGRFNPPEIIDKYTIKFTAKTVHYNNLVTLSGFNVLPKHLFSGKDFNKDFTMSLPGGSGPYILSEVKEGRYYVLKRRKDYWADILPQHRGMFNFNEIKYKVIRDDNVAFEGFKKGDFDIFDDITAKRWVTETNSEHFQKNWIVKQKIYNYAPQGFQGLAFNLRKPLFQDLRVRQAIFYLLDRKTLLDKIMFNQYQPLSSYWPSLYGTSKANDPVDYNPEKAKQLLNEVGYTRLDKEGYLINQQNERLEFTIYYASESLEKHLTLFVDTCKQSGVKVNLELLSWATLLKKAEDYSFDLITMAWTGTLFDDPEQLWHSKHMSEVGGNNISGYKNEEVDRLIDSLPPIFDPSKRIEIIKKIDGIIYQDVPYVLFWGANYSKIFYKNIFGMPKTIFSKYSSGDVIAYWWFDPAKMKLYQEAIKKNKSLRAEPVEVYYDKIAESKGK
jgi:microcin C transport system substrate-binding protein